MFRSESSRAEPADRLNLLQPTVSAEPSRTHRPKTRRQVPWERYRAAGAEEAELGRRERLAAAMSDEVTATKIKMSSWSGQLKGAGSVQPSRNRDVAEVIISYLYLHRELEKSSEVDLLRPWWDSNPGPYVRWECPSPANVHLSGSRCGEILFTLQMFGPSQYRPVPR